MKGILINPIRNVYPNLSDDYLDKMRMYYKDLDLDRFSPIDDDTFMNLTSFWAVKSLVQRETEKSIFGEPSEMESFKYNCSAIFHDQKAKDIKKAWDDVIKIIPHHDLIKVMREKLNNIIDNNKDLIELDSKAIFNQVLKSFLDMEPLENTENICEVFHNLIFLHTRREYLKSFLDTNDNIKDDDMDLHLASQDNFVAIQENFEKSPLLQELDEWRIELYNNKLSRTKKRAEIVDKSISLGDFNAKDNNYMVKFHEINDNKKQKQELDLDFSNLL